MVSIWTDGWMDGDESVVFDDTRAFGFLLATCIEEAHGKSAGLYHSLA